MSVPAYIKFIILSVLFIAATINVTRTTFNILRSSERLEITKEEISQLEKEKESLEHELAYKNTDEYVEEKARNDLNMIRPGEKVFVVPNILGKQNSLNKQKINDSVNTDNSKKSNAEMWIDLFF